MAENESVSVPEETWSHGVVLFADISGFTPLTERMSKEGLKGIEKLSSYLNEFFNKLIQIIHFHGGDVIKFAGDALMALWSVPYATDLPPQVVLACHCALQMLEDMKGYMAGGCPLTLHSGIGAGQISHLHVGGTNGRREYLICGEFIDQVSECEKKAESGQVYISHTAFSIAAAHYKPKIFTLFITKKGRSKKKRTQDYDTCYLLAKVKQTPEYPTPHKIPITKGIVDRVSAYCPEAIKGEGKGLFIAENRLISVLFVNIDLVYSSGNKNNDDLAKLQRGVAAMQQQLYKYGGEVRQFLVDDKGSVLIGVFGLPPESHEDDGVRALLAALSISKELDAVGIKTRIGVTTGNAFCGDVGNDVRREYAMVGDIVNLSARLMGASQWGSVMCDHVTYQAGLSSARAKKEIQFETIAPIKVKGKVDLIKVYTPRLKEESSADSRASKGKRPVKNQEIALRARPSLTSRFNTMAISAKTAPKLFGRDKELNSMFLILRHVYESTWKAFCQTDQKKALFGGALSNSPTVVPSRHQREKSNDGIRSANSNPVINNNSTSSTSTSNPSPIKMHQRVDSSSSLPASGPNSAVNSAQNSPRVMSPRVNPSSLSPTSPRGPKRSPIPMQFRESDASSTSTSSLATPVVPVSNCAFVVLKAEAGFGKTALMSNVIASLNEGGPNTKFKGHGDYTILQSSCDSIEELTPYFPWRDIFGSFLNCLDLTEDLITQMKSDIIVKLEKIEPGMGNYVSLLNAVLPLDWKEATEVTALTESEKIVIREKLLVLLMAESRVMIFIDDAQWMDSCSWRLVEAFLERAQNVMIVFAVRPMHPVPLVLHRLTFRPNACLIELKRFDESCVLSTIRHVLNVDSLPAPLEKHIASKALGSPLLAKEFAYELLDSGAIEFKNENTPNAKAELTEAGWQVIKASAKDNTKVPTTLQLMLTARIDRLQPHEKLILKEASVIGTSFPFEILKSIHYLVQHTLDKESAKPNEKRLNRHNTLMLNRHLLNANQHTTLDDEDELLQTLCQLIDCDLIECINEENLTYAFKNAAIRDIVYDLLLFKDKLIIHKAVYVWYERTYESENELAPYYTVIAHHTQQAGNLEKTIAYYSKAAQSAVATGAHREAVKYLEEALRIDLDIGVGKNFTLSDVTALTSKTGSEQDSAKSYRILLIHRRLAASYYNIGMIENCIVHLLAALALMDIALPAENATDGLETVFPPSNANLLVNSSRKDKTIERTGSGKRTLEKEKSKKGTSTKERSVKISSKASRYSSDIIACMIQLAKLYYFNCNQALAVHYAISALTMSQSYKKERSNHHIFRAMLACIPIASAQGQQDVVKDYLISVAAMNTSFQLNQENVTEDKKIAMYRAMYYSSIGNWQSSGADFALALTHVTNSAETDGSMDLHEANELKYVSALNRFITGHFSNSDVANFSSIVTTGDSQFVALSLVATAQIHNHHSNKELYYQIVEELEECETMTKVDSCSALCISIILIQSQFLKEQRPAILEKLTTLSKLITKLKPKLYFMLPVYIILPLLLLGWLNFLRPEKELQKQLKALLDPILVEFESFSQTCPLAAPYMALWNALRTPYHTERPKEFALKIQNIKESAKTLKLQGLDKMCDWWSDRLQASAKTETLKDNEKVEDLLWQLFNTGA